VTARHLLPAEGRLVDADGGLYPRRTTACRFIEAAA
jgi:hypothetical protein